MRFFRFFAYYEFLGSKILIRNVELLEVWRKQGSFFEKRNAIYTFLAKNIVDSVLDRAKTFSATLWRNWQKCFRKLDTFRKRYSNWMEGYIGLNLPIEKVKGVDLKNTIDVAK